MGRMLPRSGIFGPTSKIVKLVQQRQTAWAAVTLPKLFGILCNGVLM